MLVVATYWVEDQADKDDLIARFRENTKQKQCKYVKEGYIDDCPFGNKCFYKHELPDGTIVEGDSPRTLQRFFPCIKLLRAHCFHLYSWKDDNWWLFADEDVRYIPKYGHFLIQIRKTIFRELRKALSVEHSVSSRIFLECSTTTNALLSLTVLDIIL